LSIYHLQVAMKALYLANGKQTTEVPISMSTKTCGGL
jgi:hypothetical protein